MSRVIRSGGRAPRVVPREVFDAGEEAKRIVEEARTRAADIVSVAGAEADRIREEARTEGRAAGQAEAAATLAEASALRGRALADAERDLATLAVAVAQRVIGDELALAPERVTAIAADVLARARRAHHVTITVHPADAETLRGAHDQLPFAIVEDPSITRGGCIVRTEHGQIDARIETQLDTLLEAMTRSLT